MIVEVALVCILAKCRRWKLTPLFRTWTFYPILVVQCALAVIQCSVFFHTAVFVPYARYMEPAVILSFLCAMFAYRLYRPALCGAVSIGAGTLLNRFVIAQNSGKMPVFPTLSYLTGYVTPQTLGHLDSLHVLGSTAAKWKFLADYIDYGYCILSPGDLLIHLFACLMLYTLIRAVNLDR